MITVLFFPEEKRKFSTFTDEVRKHSGQLAGRFFSGIKDGFTNFLEAINQKG